MALHLLRNSVDKLGSRAITKSIFTKQIGPTIHLTAQRDYPEAAELPLPPNVDPTETMRFSPQRSRDISSTAIICHESMHVPKVDVTLDSASMDPHVEQYDCSGAVHLSCSMQSNVPQPFSGGSKSMHLNMPGGQWSQFTKFTAADLQDHHYMSLRRDLKGTCGVLTQKVHQYVHLLVPLTHERQSVRLCTSSSPKEQKEKVDVKELSRKDKLKAAVKDYGATVIVFHVTISLASLGLSYLLVSSGLDVKQILTSLNLGDTALAGKVATEASTFVVAYAIHKVFAPVRISITLGATPFIVRYLRKRGILKVKKP
uniref:Putative conserved plasma membrane protein n=1 Tax=Nyssomyia neivai TaxID=330878 RepID=A0A1L8D9G5_9DIPT